MMLNPDELKAELLKLVRTKYPKAELSTDQYDWRNDSQCGCYSEYTTESAYFNAGFVIPGRKLRYLDVQEIEDMLKPVIKENFEWHGCECCENDLYVDVRIFQEKQ